MSEIAAETDPSAEPETTEADWRTQVRDGPWGLLCRLTGITQGRPGSCRTRRTAASVQVVAVGKDRVSLRGVATCGSVWACPVCSAAICSERARDVKQLVSDWGSKRTVMVTATIAHTAEDRLAREARGVARAWQVFWAGSGAARIKGTWGIGPWVRSVESTHGKNGWHCHIHAILCLDTEKNPTYLREDLAARWRSCVAASLGERYAPSLEHGLDVAPVRDSDYLLKLGLEMAGARKRARLRGHSHPWDIAERAAAGDPASIALWREYVEATRGHRQLTWSRDAKARIRTDAEIASDTSGGELIAEYSPDMWKLLLARPYGLAELMRMARDSVSQPEAQGEQEKTK